MKKYIFIAALLFSSGTFSQQKDSLLQRQMELERQFNPTLQDANKITTLPALHKPVIKKANTAYSSWAGRTTPPLQIAIPRSGKIMTNIPFDLKKGYISLSAGNDANVDGALGYRLLKNEKNSLSFRFLHYSTNADINYVQETEPGSNKNYLMHNEGALTYTREFNAFRLNLTGGYAHSMFNYYGNTFGSSRRFENKNQKLGIFNAYVGVQSDKNAQLHYTGNLRFRNFDTQFGASLENVGIGGNQLDLVLNMDKPFWGEKSAIGIEAQGTGVFYDNNAFHNLHHIEATPYVIFRGAAWKAKLGANVALVFAEEKKSYLSPHIELSYAVTEYSSLYADIKGGVSPNTYLAMMDESRYLQPMLAVKPSYTRFDITGGAKIGEVSGFRFDVFGGYRKTKDAHFLLLDPVKGTLPPNGFAGSIRYEDYLRPVYGTLSHSHIGAMVQSKSWAPLDIALRVTKNFYNVKNMINTALPIPKPKAYHKPGIEADIHAAWAATDNLKITANYYLSTDRWTFNGLNKKIDNINNLNLGATYQISDAFSVQLKANNVLFQTYDIWYGYPAQSFHVMGGFMFRF